MSFFKRKIITTQEANIMFRLRKIKNEKTQIRNKQRASKQLHTLIKKWIQDEYEPGIVFELTPNRLMCYWYSDMGYVWELRHKEEFWQDFIDNNCLEYAKAGWELSGPYFINELSDAYTHCQEDHIYLKLKDTANEL